MAPLRVIYADEGETVYTTETVYSDETGLPLRQLTWLDGELQSPPDDTPAQILFDESGRVREMVWWDQGKEHRDPKKGPAIIEVDPDSGTHTMERYKVAGKTSRSTSEPAFICRNRENGEITRLKFYLNGVELPDPAQDIDPNP